MNLIELKNHIDNLIRYTKNAEEKEVVIALTQSSMGPIASTGIKNIYPGIDWDKNRIIINPKRAICDKTLFENTGAIIDIKKSSDGKDICYCSKCHNKISKKDKYCKSCGIRLYKEEDFLPGGKDMKYKYNKSIHFNK